jgi:hypothetical protein
MEKKNFIKVNLTLLIMLAFILIISQAARATDYIELMNGLTTGNEVVVTQAMLDTLQLASNNGMDAGDYFQANNDFSPYGTYSCADFRANYPKYDGTYYWGIICDCAGDPWPCGTCANSGDGCFRIGRVRVVGVTRDPATTDTDGDGLVDNVDPFPNDPTVQDPNTTATQAFFAKKVYDSAGNLVYAEVWKANQFGEIIDVENYGDENYYNDIKAQIADGTIIENNPYTNPFDDSLNTDVLDIADLSQALATDINGEYEGNTPLEGDSGTQTVAGNDPIDDTGATDPGSTTTTDQKDYTSQFGAMIANQDKQISNQAAIAQRQDTTNKTLAEISGKLDSPSIVTIGGVGDTSTGEGLSQAEVEAAVGNALDSENAEAETEAGNLSGVADPTFDTDISGDIPEENLLSDILDGLRANNPVTAYIDSIDLQTTGACEMEFDWSFGEQTHTTKLSMCQYQSDLQTWGTVLLSVTTILSIVMVVRR